MSDRLPRVRSRGTSTVRKERGILFSAPMVRAILEGRKTQTRRVCPESWLRCLDPDDADERQQALTMCPYGQPGDRLWVRETWGAVWPGEFPRPLRECKIEYRADLPPGCTDRPGGWPAEERDDAECPKWRPSLHMPRWASRILLEVTEVRVERLQDISEDDARAEGVTALAEPATTRGAFRGHRDGFAALWEAINGKRAPWASNPWVWVVSFRRIEPAAREVA
jgi:hypothetical protein